MPLFSTIDLTYAQTRSTIRLFLADPRKITIFNGLFALPDMIFFFVELIQPEVYVEFDFNF